MNRYGREKPPLGVRLDRHHPSTIGLRGAWIFNERMGTIFNDIACGRQAVGTTNLAYNNPSFDSSTAWKFGWEAGISPNRSGPSYATVSHDPGLAFSTAVSLMVIAAMGATENGIIVGKDSNTLGRSFDLEHYSNAIRWYINGGAGNNLLSVAHPSTLGWHTYTGTWDGTNGKMLRLYYDGIQVGSKASTDATLGACTAPIGFGRRYYTGVEGYLTATIACVYLWARELSPDEVFALARDPYVMCQATAALRFPIYSPAGFRAGPLVNAPILKSLIGGALVN